MYNLIARILILLLVCNIADGAQIPTKFIEDNAVTDAKIRLRNNQYLRARNNLDTLDVNMFSVTTGNVIRAGAQILPPSASSTQLGSTSEPWSFVNSNGFSVYSPANTGQGQMSASNSTPSGAGTSGNGANFLSLGTNKYIAMFSLGGAASSPAIVETGNASAGTSGLINIQTGTATGNSGSINLQTGTSGATRGKIIFKDGTEGTAGHVWTSSNTTGTGGWAAPSVSFPLQASDGTSAAPAYSFSGNTNMGLYRNGTNVMGIAVGGLSKLEVTTASLQPTSDNTFQLGDDNLGFNSAWIHSVRVGNTSGSNIILNDSMSNVPSGSTLVGIRKNGASTTGLGFTTNNASGAATAPIRVETGNVTSGAFASGDIVHRIGTSTGTQGKIRLQDGTEGTSGQVWVSTDTSGAGAWSATAATWHKYTVTHTALQAAALTNNIELFSLPTKGIIQGVVIKHSTAFAGTSVTGYTVSVGIAGNLNKYASDFDVFQATGSGVGQTTNVMDFESTSGATSIKINATSTGANLDQSTAGSVDVWVLWGVLN